MIEYRGRRAKKMASATSKIRTGKMGLVAGMYLFNNWRNI